MSRILRTACSVNYTTPTGGALSLPINCANSESSAWPWKYFFTQTTETETPITSNGIVASGVGATHEASSELGQAIVRVIFAYIATDPISATISAAVTGWGSPSYPEVDNFTLIARLYSPDGGQVSEFFNTSNPTKVEAVTLPATTCPLVVWVGAASQPTGADFEDLPPCTASASVSL